MFFEIERKHGGGPVRSVQLYPDKCQAIIEFQEPRAVDNVLGKLPIKMKNRDVHVEVYVPRPESEESYDPQGDSEEVVDDEEATVQILVSNIPAKAFNEYHLELFFEKMSGSDVVHIQLLHEYSAIIQFDTPQAVECLMRQQPLIMCKAEVEIEPYKPPGPVMCDTIEVWGEDLDEDLLELYFESEKRSSGGPIEKLDVLQDGKVAYIKFCSEEVAQRVAEKDCHIVPKQQLQVNIYQPVNPLLDQTDGPARTRKRKDKDQYKRQGSADWAEPKSSRVMRVEGMKRVRSQEAVQYYFENKRKSGGGKIDNVRMDEWDSNVMYVTFISEQDADTVVTRTSHVVEGCELLVSLYSPPPPPPMYENRLLVRGIKPWTSREHLFDFLREKSGGVEPQEQQLGETEDTRIVTFNLPIDFAGLQQHACYLEGASLQLQRVPVSNCIYVTNYDQSVGRDTMQLYFESERRSGGGQDLVERVVVNKEEGFSLVYFVNHIVVEKILQREHILHKKKLIVKLFFECLGRPKGDGDIERYFEIPYSQRIRFILNSDTSKRKFESQMEQLNAKIHWPTTDTQLPVNVECTLKQKAKKSHKTANEWRQKAEKCFKEYLNKITVVQHPVKSEHWAEVIKNLREITITNSDAVQVFCDKDQENVTVTGSKKQADQVSGEIRQAIETIETSSELARNKIKERMTDLKLLETKLLLAMKFPATMEQRYQTLSVKINQDRKAVMFEGLERDVAAARLDMLDIRDRFAVHVINDFPEQKICMYMLKEVREYIVQLLRQHGLSAVWEVSIDELTVCCPSSDILPSCLEIICAAVRETSIPTSKASRSVVNTDKWDTMVQNVQARHPRKVMITVQDMAKVIITSTDDVEKDVVSVVKQFLTSNAIVYKKVPVSSGVSRLLNQRHRPAVERIAKSLAADHVQIASTRNIFNIRGNAMGVVTARRKLLDLVSSVQSREYTVTKPGLGPYLSKNERSKTVGAVESQLPCVVIIRGLDEEEIVLQDVPSQASPGYSSPRGHGSPGGHNKQDQASPRGRRKEQKGKANRASPRGHRIESKDDTGRLSPAPYSMDTFADTGQTRREDYGMDSMAESSEAGLGGYNTSNVGASMPTPALPPGMRLHASCQTSGGRRLFTVEGDMTEMGVDILVNTADKKISLAGGLGKIIVRKGGKAIRDACSNYIARYSTLEEGAVFLSPGGNLKAGAVVHVVGPAWQSGQNREQERLAEAVSKVMQQAAMQGVTSIAFPAISCGTFGFPSKVATSVIVQAIQNYFREDQDCLIRTVFLCDVKPETIEGFTEAMSRCFGAVNTSAGNLQPPPGPRQRKVSQQHPPSSPQAEDQAPGSPKLPGSKAVIGNITVSIVKGELAKLKVDAIVNTTSEHLDLTHGAVSRNLLSAAGPSLQDEVRTRHPGRLTRGDIVVTCGYNLDCDIVMHTAIPSYYHGPAIRTLQGVMDKCLTEAASQNLCSIAFPALGTGNLKFPKDVVAKEMFKAVETFTKKSPRSSITDVMFVVYHRETATVKAFEAEECRWLGGRQVGAWERVQDDPEHELGSESDMFDDEPLDFDDLESSSDALPSPADTCVNKFGDITVTVKSGDITREICDCIVNSSNEDLDLSRGSVSQALQQKGGKQLESELKRKRGKMRSKGITKTKAPGLQCGHIVHIVAQDSLDGWRKITTKCLHYAEKKKIHCIAFPALGTGISMLASDIAEVMLSSLVEFSASNPKHVREVRFVIFQWQMEQDFKKAVRDMKAAASSSGPPCKDAGAGVPSKTLCSDMVTFVVHAMSHDVITQATSQLESILNTAMFTKVFQDSTVRRLDAKQVTKVKQLARESNACVQFDDQGDVIRLTGMDTTFIDVTDKIYRVLRDVDDQEYQKTDMSLIANITQWFFIEITKVETKLVKYDKEVNWKIEKAFQAQKPTMEYKDNVGDQVHVVDFSKMEEYPKSNPADIVQVIRRDLIQDALFEPPAGWSPMGHTENLKVVPLKHTEKEYTDLAKKFIESAGQPYKIMKIERLQNKTLWQQYVAKKKQLEQQNPPNTQNEQQLWHGFAVDAMASINAHGFNRSYCGKNATVFGDGVYFAVHASYSCNDQYSRPDTWGLKRMYFCRVLTGVYTRGERGMRVSPPKPAAGKDAIYDSVVNNMEKPIMYVIFNDTQAYPEYAISFRK